MLQQRRGGVEVTAPSLSRKDRAILAMTPEDIARFWAKVDKTPGQGPKGECWVWTAGVAPLGYGLFKLGTVTVSAHRAAFFLANGHLPPPEAPFALHSCDNRPCVRCLWSGTPADNSADMKAKGRSASGDRSGSRLHPERRARGDRHGSRLHPETRPRGEKNTKSKLTTPQVVAIRDRYAQGGVTLAVLAREYGVTSGAIGFIVRRESWAHV